MKSLEPPRPLPSIGDLEAHLRSLTMLRQQMLELHARVEYLRLMMRLSTPH